MKKVFLFVLVFIFLVASVDGQVKGVDAVGIVVSDMDRAMKFYSEVLNFKKLSDVELQGSDWEKLYDVFGLHIRKVTMQLGDENIELIDYLTSGGRSILEDFKSNDLSFQHIAIVVSDMDTAYKILRRFNVVHVSTAPQTLPPSIPEAAGVKAFYFQDPDRHNLELIYFPKGKGQEKWQHTNNRIFLGIDHTAIGVSNTDNSHKFYHDILGFDRKGDSWNKGNEQAHLNNVEAASLHITGYRSAAGIGVEFLQYLNPGPGKKYPDDTRADDTWNWVTTVVVDNAEKVFEQLQSLNYQFVSKGLVQLQQGKKTQKAFIVRDPDGHAVCVTGKRAN
jgi:catechol 2,3-dioxygenase-like lactoylglutathione lyase family enzyme